MSYNKNTAGQKVSFMAYSIATGLPATGDAANITAKISIDFGTPAALTDINPVELDPTDFQGVYVFDLSQAETNGDVLAITATSSTANVQLDRVNIYTVEPVDFSALETKIDTIDGVVDTILVDTNELQGNQGDWATATGFATATSLSITNSNVNDIKAKTDQLAFTVANQVDSNSLTGGTSPSAIYDYFVDGSREDLFKADISSLATSASILALNDFDPTNDVVARVTLVDTTTTNTDMTSGTSPTAIYTYFTDASREDAVKADVSLLASASSLTRVGIKVDGIKNRTDQLVFSIPNQVDANALTGGGSGGSGSIEKTITVCDNSSNPLDGVAVWVSTDIAGTNVVAGTSYTDAFGNVTFMLDAGTYYGWQQLAGYNFTNPTSFTVS